MNDISEFSTELCCIENYISLMHTFFACLSVSQFQFLFEDTVGYIPLGCSDRLRIHMVQPSLIHAPAIAICAASISAHPAHILHNS